MKNLNEFLVPAGEGRVFTVRKGQTVRVVEVEGPQAGDMIIFNLHNWKESYCAWLTLMRNDRSFIRVEKLYSKPPAGSLMFTINNPREGVIWLDPSRCNKWGYEVLYGTSGYHNHCQDILAECIKPYGLTPFDVPDVLNLFMNAEYDKDGTRVFKQSPVKQGDYVEMLAEMDLLCAISACPNEAAVFNAGGAKPLGIQVFD